MPKPLLYDQLADKLCSAIRSGRYAVGDLLPKEVDIAQMESVSRFTVRAALKKLEQHSMIRRIPHVGTRVISRGIEQGFNQQISSFSDLDRLASVNTRKILSIEEIVVSKELAAQIHYPPGETLIRFEMVRQGSRSHEPPIAKTTEYVRREWQELVLEAPKQPDRLMIDLITAVYGKRCAEIRQTIEATLLTEDEARVLQAHAGTPALRIRRLYLAERGTLLLSTVSIHPAARYAFNLNLRVGGNAAE